MREYTEECCFNEIRDGCKGAGCPCKCHESQPDAVARTDALSPEAKRAAAEQYLTLIVDGTVMGAASHGIILAHADVRRALLASTPDYPGAARVTDLVRRKAAEQGIPFPEPLLTDQGMT